MDFPNPHYIAIHAVIAEILHVSGAGRFFDELLYSYRGNKGVTGVRSWPELEALMAEELLKESFIDQFNVVNMM